MNYRIFRSQLIMTINDLAQIGLHNKREKKAYKSNKDIKLEKYVKGFKLKVKDYEKEHNERMKTELPERKTFNEMLSKSKSIVKQLFLFYNILIQEEKNVGIKSS